MAKFTRITIETDSLLVLRGRKSLRTWSLQCGVEAEMIPLKDVGVGLNLPPAAMEAGMDSPDLHHAKTVDDTALIRLDSSLSGSGERGWRTVFRLIPCCKGKNSLHKGETMKLSNTAKGLIIAAVFALAATAPTAKAAGCSNGILKGTYSDQDTGTIVGVGPFAGVNVDSFDGHGKITISGISSLNGSVSPGVATGTYHVNPDCTGTYTVQDSFGNTFDAFFVIGDGGNELRIVITDPGTVINCLARKQFPEQHD